MNGRPLGITAALLFLLLALPVGAQGDVCKSSFGCHKSHGGEKKECPKCRRRSVAVEDACCSVCAIKEGICAHCGKSRGSRNGSSGGSKPLSRASGSFGPWYVAPPLPDHPEHVPDFAHQYYGSAFAVGDHVYFFAGQCGDAAVSRVGSDGKFEPWKIVKGEVFSTRGLYRFMRRGNTLYAFEGYGIVYTAEVNDATGAFKGWPKIVGRYGIAGHGLHMHDVGWVFTGDKMWVYSVAGFEYVGGTRAGATITQHTCYAPVNDDGSFGEWKETTPFPLPTLDATVVTVGNRIYAVGGGASTDPGGMNTDLIHMAVAKPEGGIGEWVPLGRKLPQRCRGTVAFQRGGHLYVIGGIGGDVPRGKCFMKAQRAPIMPGGDLGGWQDLPAPPGEVGTTTWGFVGPYLFVAEHLNLWPEQGKPNKEIPKVFYCPVPQERSTGGRPAQQVAQKPKSASEDAPPAPAAPASSDSDDVYWKEVAKVRDNKERVITCGFRAVKTKELRLRVSGKADRVRLGEILLFGPSGILFASSCESEATADGFDTRALADGDDGFAEGEKKRGWASKPGAEHEILFRFNRPTEVFQLKITTVDEEEKRASGFTVEVPR